MRNETKKKETYLGNLCENSTLNLDEIIKEKLDNVFYHQNPALISDNIGEIVSTYLPIDLAYASSALSLQHRLILYEKLPNIESKVQFLINTDSSTRSMILRYIQDYEAKDLIASMPSDEALKLLEDMSERRFRRVMDLLESKKAERIREIKKHEKNTAGRLMTNEFFCFPMHLTIQDAATLIRDHPGIDLSRQIFVVNENDELKGYVPARHLIVYPSKMLLKDVMRPVLYKVYTDTPREEVIDIAERYKLSSLPVIDKNDKIAGLITHDEIMEAIEDIADHTIAQMAGTGENVRDQELLWKRFLARVPWLIVTLFAGLLNVGVMASLQSYENGLLTFVLFFVPLITGLSGNIGVQCSTILVRSLAMGGPSSCMIKKETLTKEVTIGVLIGILFGILSGSLIWMLDFFIACDTQIHSGIIGAIVGIGLWGACLASTLLGVFSPLFFMKIKVDPAVASGPIVTAINDVLSMSIYFLIALILKAFLL